MKVKRKLTSEVYHALKFLELTADIFTDCVQSVGNFIHILHV
jgi:hypothetical protein